MTRPGTTEPPRYVLAEIRHLLAKPGCPLCRAEEEALERFLFWFLHESYGEPDVILQYVRARGFCPEHTRLLAARGPQWQLSAIYSQLIEDLLHMLDEKLTRLADDRPRAPWQRRTGPGEALQPAAPCVFCEVIERTRESVAPMLLEALPHEEALRLRFAEVGGCCVPHALLVARQAKPDQRGGLAVVLRVLQEELGAVKRDLDEFFRKADYRYAEESRGAEQDAWRQELARCG